MSHLEQRRTLPLVHVYYSRERPLAGLGRPIC
jgi:hypothetical protein